MNQLEKQLFKRSGFNWWAGCWLWQWVFLIDIPMMA